MDVEAVVTERLQKLRQWQAEQQEKLLKEQQMQREILSHKQDRIYKALGLPLQDLSDIVENTNKLLIHSMISENEVMSTSLDSALKETKKGIMRDTIALYENYNKEEEAEDSDCISETVDDNRNSTKDYSFSILQKNELDADLLIEGIAPLSLNNVASNERVSLDDIPVPSSKKDFQTLLKEKLDKESDIAPRSDSQTKIKKSFLKKGQGLLRFKMSANSPAQSTTTRRRGASSTVNTQDVNKIDKDIKATVQKNAFSGCTSIEKRRLTTVPSSRRKAPDKPALITPIEPATATANGTRHLSETNVSDFDSKTERELEEQSTPFKVRERLNRSESEIASAKQQHNKRTSDTAKPASAKLSSEQFHLRHRSHSAAAAINSYWDTITIDDSTEEEAPKHRLMMIDEILQNDEDCQSKDISCGEPAVIASLTDSDEERDVPAEDCGTLVPKNVHPDSSIANHRVRFSEHNEYRTIDLNVSNASSRSSLVCYLEQNNGNDSVNTSPELSDVEEKSPLNYEENTSARQVNGNDRAINASIQLSLQQGITENSYYRMMKALKVSDEENSAGCEDESPGEENEKIVETYNEEQASVLSSSSSLSSLSDAHQMSSMRQREEYALKSEPATDKTNTFEPELLKSRLLELEKEIDIFRKESSALLLQRRRLQEDQATLHKEYMEKERNFEESKRRVQIQLEEEKRRLAREKAAMENRIRDAQEKARHSKMERQKAQNLEEELEKLKDELNIRESRWNAAESRYKSELRALRTEISKLKQEIASLQTAKKTNAKNVRKAGGQAFARATDRRINRPTVAISSREIPAKSSRNLPAVFSNTSVHEEDDEDKPKTEDEPTESITKATDGNSEFAETGDTALVKKRESKREREIGSRSRRSERFAERNANEARKKRDLYKNLLNDATSDLVADQCSSYTMQGISDLRQPIVTCASGPSAKCNDDFYSSSASENLECATTTTCIADDLERCNRSCQLDDDRDEENATMKTHDRDLSTERTDSLLRRRASSVPSGMDIVRHIEHADGRVEYWYPNGNVKKIFPDQGMTKMIYYNGDVRETERDGRVKYFYATTRTWHTTTPDGLEILEFPDGQVERRTSDGTVQVSFPDGATRIAQVNGTEKWTLPDGTVAQTFVNGDKILTLPNGQREVHTKEHKRREYPDGTVKLVYADGTQETRYSSGRKRLRDKDGNLLMDSYDT
ncbi:intracellular protein transport protein USO1 isoform X2 [Odontomachus brunneus]|uniref:intracellular protein transport protein USO1 isoform X2 n=1 Tax=Odontomachus brunneus TaxID=486640 RepID=UPI0013F2356B|nr:intracellular protein transport protein USO1 isoform X2 [Odontomachus brunneus]